MYRAASGFTTMAAAALELGLRLRGDGSWHRHQAPADVTSYEKGSEPHPDAFLPEVEMVLEEAQSFMNRVASDPPPPFTINSADLKFTVEDNSVRLRWKTHPPMASVERPSEIIHNFTNERNELLIWSAVVTEIASGWVRPCDFNFIKSAGVAFLGPKDRFLFHPRETNDMLEDVEIHYPRPSDLLAPTRAACAIKGDLKGAFRHVNVHSDDQPYLGMIRLMESPWSGWLYPLV